MSMMKLVRHSSVPQGQQQNQQYSTFANVGTLPRLPLPDFQDTLARFEQWCSPLLTTDELTATQHAIATFGKAGGAGEKCHDVLVEYDKKPEVDSWLDEFWPARYLGRRVPVSINANFVFLFKEREKNQVERAAELVTAAVDYKLRLDAETIPAPSFRGHPLCSVQNKYLFSTTRIPDAVRDKVNVPYSDEHPDASTAKHILVFHKGHAFRLNVINASGKAYPLATIEQALSELMKVSAEAVAIDSAVGYLTTLARADWANVRKELCTQNLQNKNHIQAIEEALFCLCLDEAIPSNQLTATDELLQGDGGNRWFDKSISLIVLKDGSAGVNCEHCGLDGSTVVDFVDALHADETLERLANHQSSVSEQADFTELEFALDTSLKQHISRAQNDFQALVDNTATHYFDFEDFGTSRIKCLKMSPDAFVQLAFQLAHFRTKGLIGATYESVATRHFERGRTEAMRVITAEAKHFVETMQDAKSSDDDKRAAFRKAAEHHVNRLRECQQGQAPEQHLWQLLLIAEERGAELGIAASDLALFSSPGWLKMRDDYLSTSSAPSESITVFGFGATSEQCIGVAYLPRAKGIYAYLSTPTAVAEPMHHFSQHLSTVLNELADLLAGETETA